jgi:hypothetical protein
MTKYFCGLKRTDDTGCTKWGDHPCKFSVECAPSGIVDEAYVNAVRNFKCRVEVKSIIESFYEV